MIEKEISSRIVTIGCDYETLKGGIAQVIRSYSSLFEKFYFIPTVKEGGKLFKIWVALKAMVRLCYLCVFHGVKIVHIHGCSNNSFRRKKYFIIIAKLLGRKVVFHIHGAEFKSFSQNYGVEKVIRVLNRCDIIVALSQSWKEYFISSLKQKHVLIINNIVDYPVVMQTPKKDSVFNIVFLGEIGKRKGIFDLVDMLLNFHEEYKGCLRLHIGGNGEVEELQRMIEPIKDVVEFYGWVDVEMKRRLLSQANAYILPSYNEGLPISILEAMSYKLPIVSTRVGGIPEIVKDGYNGFLIDPGDKNAMKEAIDKLLVDEKLQKKMGEYSYEIVQKYFPQEVEKQLLDLYKSLL